MCNIHCTFYDPDSLRISDVVVCYFGHDALYIVRLVNCPTSRVGRVDSGAHLEVEKVHVGEICFGSRWGVRDS